MGRGCHVGGGFFWQSEPCSSFCRQTRCEREMQQQMLLQDEETVELRETFSSLQQEVELKTKKLKKVSYTSDLQIHRLAGR